MKAIYGHKLYTVLRDTGVGVELSTYDSDNTHEIFFVGHGYPGLIIDPTDLEIKDEVEP